VRSSRVFVLLITSLLASGILDYSRFRAFSGPAQVVIVMIGP
jgi:hypothetical protein